MPKALDISGQRFGRLVVLCRVHQPGARNAIWQCQCDCGQRTTAAAGNLGKTKFSCGCLQSESATASLRVNRLARPNLHGLSNTAEWRIWSKMRDRCSNPNNPRYHHYGGRGITVDQRWDSFETFLADMGHRPSPRHSIDRKDNNGNYTPENCHWATMDVQARNTSTNHWIVIDGIRLCYRDWCKTLGVGEWKPREMSKNHPLRFPTVGDAVRHLFAERKHR